MDGQIIFICILIAVGIVVLRMVISRVIHKGSNAIERAIRPNAAREADTLIGTAVIFEINASLSAVRRAVADNVPVIDKIGHKMKVLEDSANGISWALGLPGMGQGVVCVLRYKEQNGGTAALFEITQHVTSSGVSPFVKQISELRDQVITALKAADPSVKITTDTQEVKYKMSCF